MTTLRCLTSLASLLFPARSIVAVLLCCTMGAIKADTTAKLPLFSIDARDKTPQMIGFEAGQQAKQAFPDIESRYDNFLASRLSQSVFDAILQHSLPPLLTGLPQETIMEMQGVVSTWALGQADTLGDGQLSLNEYLTLNLLPDLGFMPDGSGFGAFDKVTAARTPIVGRNLDWQSTPELRSLQAITRYQYAERTITNIGFAGIISVLSGFNDQGLFVALLNAQPYSPYPLRRVPSSGLSASGFEMREALRQYSSLKQATPKLKRKRYRQASNILMADRKQIQVLEHPAQQTALVRYWNSPLHTRQAWEGKQQIAVIDCHLLAELPGSCTDVKDMARWQRLRELAIFTPQHPATFHELSAILFDTDNRNSEIFNSNTLQSMIYQPVTQRLYLYSAAKTGEHVMTPMHQLYPEIFIAATSAEQPVNYQLMMIWLLLIVLIIPIIRHIIRTRRM